jgi:hypothetical protein
VFVKSSATSRIEMIPPRADGARVYTRVVRASAKTMSSSFRSLRESRKPSMFVTVRAESIDWMSASMSRLIVIQSLADPEPKGSLPIP